MVAGVCGGIGEYFNVDPTFVRLAFVLLVLANGVGILLYIIGAFIIPLNPAAAPVRGPPLELQIPSNLVEIIILTIGALLLVFGLSSFFWFSGAVSWSPWLVFGFIGRVMWSIALIVVGVLILVVGLSSRRRKT
ncbi:MAG: PspC domain-containing protein [Nitrososphaerales archaeon]